MLPYVVPLGTKAHIALSANAVITCTSDMHCLFSGIYFSCCLTIYEMSHHQSYVQLEAYQDNLRSI
jgi:hypothetical protein